MPGGSNETEMTGNGTSQAERRLDALDPDNVRVDERSLQDLLGFVRRYAGELRYFGLNNQPSGDWKSFLGTSDAEFRLADAALFLQDPTQFNQNASPKLFRPHLVLFLTFLRLFQNAQVRLNEFGQRHLDFYFRQVLGMTKKSAVPDQVNLLIDLAAGVSAVEIPAGSRASAGPDSLGRDLIYTTDRTIVANRTKITRLSSLSLDRRVVGIREARQAHANDRIGAQLAMLQVALGDPNPGDPLPLYPNGRPVNDALLKEVLNFLQFADADLFLKFFELRTLIRLKHQRDNADAEWIQINEMMQSAWKRRDPNAGSLLPTSRDFEGNLKLAVGTLDFAGLPEVKSVYDAYDHRTRSDVIEFIQQKLFMDPSAFVSMMQIKVRIDGEWAEINRILQQAGAAKTPSFQLGAIPGFDPTNFGANLHAALSPNFSILPGVTDMESYYSAVLQAEGYFFVSAEDVLQLLVTTQMSNPDPLPPEWDKAAKILASAHKEKIYTGRRRMLQTIREKQGFTAMVRFALGEDPSQADNPAAVLDRLRPFVLRDTDFSILQTASQGPENQQDWPQIYVIVEVAQRNREALPEPVAQRVDWLNLYPVADATKELVAGSQGGANVLRWKTFGIPGSGATADNPPTTQLGWALNSPLLAMSEGNRTITLTLGFRPEQFDDASLKNFLATDPLRFEISTQKGWKEGAPAAQDVGAYSALSGTPSDLKGIQWKLVFDSSADPFAAPAAGETGEGNLWPVLRLTLKQIWHPDTKQFTMPYPQLAGLLLVTAQLKVEVSGLKTISIANDENTLDASKPFLPFGSTPVAGARFFIGHPEIVTKKLDSLTFHLEWLGVSKNLAAYYKNYGVDELNSPNAFAAKVILFDQRADLTLLDQAPLFSNPATNPGQIGVSLTADNLPKGYKYEDRPQEAFATDLLSSSRYFAWELNPPDFQHQSYAAIASGNAIDLSAAIASGTFKPADAANYKVNPPYTPKLKSLALDYTASREIPVSKSAADSVDHMFHVHPFGYDYVKGDPTPSGFFSFLPHYDNEGELYIGLSEVDDPQNLTLLFEAAEGSANPDLAPPAIQWSVLSGDRWLDLDGRLVLSDTTRGLINTGILEIDLPAVDPSTRMPDGLYWIRASAQKNCTAVCDTIAFQSQAVSATLSGNDHSFDHYLTPLPSGKIKTFSPPISGISGVRQPYTSIGGRAAEEDKVFNTRVSERLRHKQRALSAWDYERLVLAQFPEVYKVKCVPSSGLRNPDDFGVVRVIAIPDIRNKMPFDPFEPKASAEMLAKISEYLTSKVPAWAVVKVQNAHYVTVKLRLAVRFAITGDESYYKQRLNDDLNHFLSPWAYQEGADIVIGGRIYANSIVDFVDRRSYVDFVANVELFGSDDGEHFARVPTPPTSDPRGYYITTDRPDAILVAARDHQIDLVPDTGYSVQLLTGIDYMKLELDFVVA